MGLVALRCPHCDGEIQLDDAREFGFCMYCGSKVLVEKSTDGRVALDESSRVMALVDAAFQFREEGMEADAYAYAKRALDIDASEPQAWYIVGLTSPRPEERKVAFRRAMDLFDDEVLKAGCKEAYDIVSEFLEENRPDGKIRMNVVSEMEKPCTVVVDGEEHQMDPGESFELVTDKGYHCFKVKGSGLVTRSPDSRPYRSSCTVRVRPTLVGAYITVDDRRPGPLHRYTVQSLRPA